jgi:hypothetical protein
VWYRRDVPRKARPLATRRRAQLSPLVLDRDLALAIDRRVAESGLPRSEVLRNALRRGLALPGLEESAGYVEGRMAGLAEVKRAFGEAAAAAR